MSLVRTVAMLGMLIVMTRDGLCDIAPARSPLPRPPLVVPVKIEKSDDPQPQARIVIPRSILPELLKYSDTQSASGGTPHVGTIIAGLALSGAAISLMFVLRNSPRRKLGLACLIVCVVLVAVVLLMDGTPLQRSKPRESFDSESEAPSQIEIVIQDQGHEVILTVPRTR